MSKLVVGNQKTTMDIKKVSEFLKVANKKIKNKNVVICPTSIYIPYYLKNGYEVGIQNICNSSSDSNTGGILASQAYDIGINYVILGHSEVRSRLKETDSIINSKVKEALKNNLKVILCIGETLEQREMLRTNIVLKREITNCLMGVDNLDDVIIAYEPIWAIGTGQTPSNKEIATTVSYIKKTVNNVFSYDDIKVLYGGSVNKDNIEKINKIDEINGVLVGKSSKEIDDFLKIIEVVVDQ